jgi:hypothetical protein
MMTQTGTAIGGKRLLIDESAPRLAALIAQDDAVAIGDPGDRLAFLVAEAIADHVVGILLRNASPHIAELVPKTNVVSFAKAIDHALIRVLKTEEAAWGGRMNASTPVNHTFKYKYFRFKADKDLFVASKPKRFRTGLGMITVG